jgi:Undecaprenyl-phosphate glucose phosphotransferase
LCAAGAAADFTLRAQSLQDDSVGLDWVVLQRTRHRRLRSDATKESTVGISDRRIEQALDLRGSEPEYRHPQSMLPHLARAADAIVIGLVGLLGVAGLAASGGAVADLHDHVLAVGVIALGHVAFGGWRGLYGIDAIMRPSGRIADMALCLACACGLFLAAALLFRAASAPWVFALALTGAALAALVPARLGLARLFTRLRRRGVVGSSLVVLGAGEQARRFIERLTAAAPPFVALDGVFDPDYPAGPCELGGQPVLGGLDELLAHARARKIDDVAVAMSWRDEARVAEAVKRLRELPINVHLFVDVAEDPAVSARLFADFGGVPLLRVARRPIEGWNAVVKSASDYVLAGLAIILISPLLALIAAAVRLDSPGPIFFRQNRLGYNNKPFSIYKFRSMYHQAVPESVVQQARKGDPRVTRVGKFIRATSLDELPQLFNVLDGTMSLVGPRPHAMSHNEEYGRKIHGYFARHRVKPGITGWSQVNGLRGETEALELMEARVRHDVHYADNWSLLFDLRILVMTALFVLFQKTAY